MDLLPDPCKDRFVKTLPCPPNKPLPESTLYPYKGNFSLLSNSIGEDSKKPDWRTLKDFLLREGPMRKDQVTRLLKEGIALLSNSPSC